MRPYETDGLTAYRQLPMVVVLPETTEQVAEVLRYCHDEGIKVVPRGAGTSLSGGALPLGDGVLLGMAKFNRIREIDFENRVAVVEPGVTNLAVTNAVARCRLLLRAGSVLADRLHDRRQRGGEFRRRALPQIRHDDKQPAGMRDRAHNRRSAAHRRQASRRGGLRSAWLDHRLGRVARRRHGSDGAHPEEAGDRARAAGRLPVVGRRRRMRLTHHRRGNHSGRHGNHGRARDRGGRGIRARRLSARCRGAADRRARRARSRSRSSDRARRKDCARLPRDLVQGLALGRGAAAVLGRPQGRIPGGRAHLAGLLSAWTAPFRARSCRWCSSA